MVLAFAATLALSALLLFSVQPMVAKMLLPVLGGAPATWAVSLCFFQALLLAGYAYAHLVGLTLATRWALVVHAGLLLAAFATLPIQLPPDLAPPEGSPYLWLLAMLATLVGLPFFTLSANAPLLQLWFGRSGHRRSADPYFLYGASNAGSLVALLAYPVLIEPLLRCHVQSHAWNWGFLALVLAVVGCGLVLLARERQGLAPPEGHGDQARRRGRQAGASGSLGYFCRSCPPACSLPTPPTSRPTSHPRRCSGPCRSPSTWRLSSPYSASACGEACGLCSSCSRWWLRARSRLTSGRAITAGLVSALVGMLAFVDYQPAVSRPALQAPTRGGSV